MRFDLDPLAPVRAGAVSDVNAAFNAAALADLHRNQAHAWKRETAAAVAAGDELDADHPFAGEAALRGLSLAEFAELILAKPVETDTLELARQRHLLAIETAATPDEVMAIVAQAKLETGGR